MQKNTEQIFGSKEFRFKLKEDWAKWPEDWKLGDCAAVGVDSKDNVYAFHRGEHPVVVFDRDGNVMKTWGEGIFVRPHGIHVGPDDYIYLTDDNDQTVRKCTVDGKVLLTIGVPGRKAAYMGGEPFRYCTHTALSPMVMAMPVFINIRQMGVIFCHGGSLAPVPVNLIFHITSTAMLMDGYT